MNKDIPAVVSIVSVSSDGWMNLNKVAREHLGLKKSEKLYLRIWDEVVLTVQGDRFEQITSAEQNRIRLPEKARKKLGIDENAFVALVERRDALAIKTFVIEEQKAEKAKNVDYETAYKITRVAETNLMPDELLPRLKEQHKAFKPKYDIKNFLRNRQSFEAWKSRQILGASEPSDQKLRLELIEERLRKQRKDGSWDGSVTVTARYLRELAELGMTRDNTEIRKAVDWLLNRPQSMFNPGMFFLKDELVAEQEMVIKSRQQQKKGSKKRFRQVKSSEKNLVKAADNLIVNPCGPRIMWPNALVLEALLMLGYEKEERVQTALRTMITGSDWCECGFQHGLSDWKRKEPYSIAEIERIEKVCIQQYRFGGLRGLEELKTFDLAHTRHRLRTARKTIAGVDEYLLAMPSHIQGCEAVTTRALSHVKDEKMRRFAEAHLWRFAGIQLSTDGEFPIERHGTGH